MLTITTFEFQHKIQLLLTTHQNVVRRAVDAGEDVDVVCGEVSAVAGALAGAAAPARGQHRLARVGLVQQDQVALLQAQEQRRGRVPCNE